MAARQDQTLQIALIVFAILTVLLAATTYLFWKGSSDAQKEIAAKSEQLSGQETAARNLAAENQRYRTFIGVGENDNEEDVQKTVDEDMQRWGSSFDESRRTYRELLEIIYEENDRTAAREAEAKTQARELKDRLLAVEAEKDAQISRAEEQMQAAKEDAAQQRNQFEEDRQQLESKQQELMENVDKQRTAYETRVGALNEQVTQLTSQLEDSARATTKLLDERKQADQSFEVADGRVSWVNQDGTVWINLGSADALRPQITFSVYDSDLPDPARAEIKGSIEVTRVLGDHMAEARVTSDDPTNPILTGDNVYSQVWHSGKALRFALTGVIDIDGDGRSDLQRALDLVRINGGTVDAYLAEDGKVEGEMTVDTRYLVLGEFPESATSAAIREGWSQMSEDADRKGVETILLTQFLDQMGFTPEERTVALGADARESDFTRPDDGNRPVPTASSIYRTRGSDRSPRELFRSRTPYANGTRLP